MGKSPNTSIENSVKLKTSVVEARRDASTVEAMSAALVDNDAGNLAAAAAERSPTVVVNGVAVAVVVFIMAACVCVLSGDGLP